MLITFLFVTVHRTVTEGARRRPAAHSLTADRYFEIKRAAAAPGDGSH